MALEPEAAQDRLRAVVAGAHGDALLIEHAADVLGADAVEDEREDAGLLGRGADHAETRDRGEAAPRRRRGSSCS